MWTKTEVIFEIFPTYQKTRLSPDVRESNTVLNSGFYAMDSGFQEPSGWIPVFEFGFWIPIVSGTPDCGFQNPGFQIQQAKFSWFRISQAVRNRDCKCMKVIQGKLTLVRVSGGYPLWPYGFISCHLSRHFSHNNCLSSNFVITVR